MPRPNDAEEGIGLLQNGSAEKPGDQTPDMERQHVLPQASISRTRVKLSFTGPKFSRASIFPFLKRFGFILLPSFVQQRLRPQPVKPTRLHPTAYLDGIRGISALFVFFCHLSYSSHDISHSYGAFGAFYGFLRLPIIRLFYDGDPQVANFFVVSGFALSYKPVKLMRAGNRAELMNAISSSAFRRCFRLFLPCLASTLLIVVLLRLGVYELTRELSADKVLLPHWREIHAKPQPTLFAQLRHWFATMYAWSTAGTGADQYDMHLWTIPIEMKASFLLFVTQVTLAGLEPMIRISALILLICICAGQAYWTIILFYAGFVLAEGHIANEEAHRELAAHPQPEPTMADIRRQKYWNIFWLLNFISGLFFLSEPLDGGPYTPGWVFLSSLIPRSFVASGIPIRFYTGIGAMQLVWATSNAPFLQRIFDNRVSQYLGKISYALYLVHGTCIHTVGYFFMDFFWSTLGTHTVFIKELGFAFAALITIAAVICAADLFWRMADVPSIRFARWLEGICRSDTWE